MKKQELEKIVTPDLESVNPLAQLSQTNNSFLPTTIGRQTNSKINCPDTQANGCNNNESCETSQQNNHVQENRGVTGISGTGHTINNYACPQEIILTPKASLPPVGRGFFFLRSGGSRARHVILYPVHCFF